MEHVRLLPPPLPAKATPADDAAALELIAKFVDRTDGAVLELYKTINILSSVIGKLLETQVKQQEQIAILSKVMGELASMIPDEQPNFDKMYPDLGYGRAM